MTEFVHVVCPSCAAVNRLPAARTAQNPNCGTCHQPLFQGKPVAVDTDRFDRHIGRSDIPIVVDFWAPWCGPCLMMAPQYAAAAAELEPTVRLAKVNTDVETSLGSEFNIRSIPTLALFRGGREIARHSGAMGKADVVRWVRQHI